MISARSNFDHILTAIVVGTPAVFVGGLVAIIGGHFLFIVYFASIVAPIILINYRIGVWLLVFLLPFASTQLIPREVLGIQGFNPVNGVLMLTLLSLFVSFLAGRGVIQLVHLPRWFLAYVAVIAFGAYVGAGSAEHSINKSISSFKLRSSGQRISPWMKEIPLSFKIPGVITTP